MFDELAEAYVKVGILYHAWHGTKKLLTGRWFQIRLVQWGSMALVYFALGCFVYACHVEGVMGQAALALGLFFAVIVGGTWLYMAFERVRIRACLRRGIDPYGEPTYNDFLRDTAVRTYNGVSGWVQDSPYYQPRQQEPQVVEQHLHLHQAPSMPQHDELGRPLRHAWVRNDEV